MKIRSLVALSASVAALACSDSAAARAGRASVEGKTTTQANAAELQVFPDVPGLTARDTGMETDVRKPQPTVAWLLALGFLGLVVLRRTRSGPTM